MKYVLILLVTTFISSCCENPPPPEYETRMVKVKIVATKEKDSLLEYGSSGVTVLELENGTRRRVRGVLGQIDDEFMQELPFKIER